MAEAAAVIGRATRVQGRVTGEVDLEIQGFVRGEVEIGGEVTVDSGAMVDGNVTARKLVVRGAIKGDLLGRDAVLLEDGARVVGDVRAPRVAIAPGALLRGLVEADPGEGSRALGARDQTSGRAAPARDAALSPKAAPPALVRKPMIAREPAPAVPVSHSSIGAHESPRGSSGQASAAPHLSHAASAAQGADTTNHAGARRPPPPVLPSLKRARGQMVKKKER